MRPLLLATIDIQLSGCHLRASGRKKAFAIEIMAGVCVCVCIGWVCLCVHLGVELTFNWHRKRFGWWRLIRPPHYLLVVQLENFFDVPHPTVYNILQLFSGAFLDRFDYRLNHNFFFVIFIGDILLTWCIVCGEQIELNHSERQISDKEKMRKIDRDAQREREQENGNGSHNWNFH